MVERRGNRSRGAVSFETYSSERSSYQEDELRGSLEERPQKAFVEASLKETSTHLRSPKHHAHEFRSSDEVEEPATPDDNPEDLLESLRVNALVSAGAGAVLALAVSLSHLDVFGLNREQIEVSLYWFSAFLGMALFLLSGVPVLLDGWSDLRVKVVSSDLLMGLGLLLCLGVTVYGAFFDFEAYRSLSLYNSPALVLSFVSCIRYGAALFRRRLSPLQGWKDEGRVRVAAITPGTWQFVEAYELEAGDIFRIEEGDVIPLDGKIVAGGCEVVERRFSGFGSPRLRDQGQTVYAGSTVQHGFADCEVVNIAEDSGFSYFTSALSKSLNEPIDSDYKGFRIQQGVNAGLMLGAIVATGGLIAKGAEPLFALNVASSILLLTFIPTLLNTYFIVRRVLLTKLFERGVLLRSAGVIEKLSAVDTLFIEYPYPPTLAQQQVQAFDILDERIERESVVGVLLSLLSGSEDETHRAISLHLREHLGLQPTIRHVRHFQYHPTLVGNGSGGVTGVLEGAPFVFGNEQFLLDHGVQIQASDVEEIGAEEELLFLAVHDEVIARVRVSALPWLAGARLQERLQKVGVRAFLCGEERGSKLDGYGKQAGFELSSILEGLSRDDRHERLAEPQSAFFSLNPHTAASGAETSMSKFSELLWELSLTDVTLFRKDPDVFIEIFSLVKRVERIKGALLIGSIVLTIAAYLLSFSPLASPTLSAALLLAVTIASYGAVLFIARLRA